MGLVITVYVLGSVLARLFSGFLVDRFGKKKLGIISFGIFFLACITYLGVKNGLIAFLAVRFVHGMSYAVASTAINTGIISIVPQHRQGEGIGYFSMFLNLAMVIGPSIGLFLWKYYSITIILWAVVVLAFIALVCMTLLRIPETKPAKTDLTWHDIIEVRALPLSFVAFCIFFSYSSLVGFLASFTQELKLENIASIFFVIYGVMIVGFRPFIAKLFDRLAPSVFFYPSILLFIGGMVLLGFATTNWMVIASGVLMGLSYGVLNPLLQNLTIQQVPVERIGAATATFFLMCDLGYGIGSYLLGIFAAATDYRMMFIGSASVSFISLLVYLAIGRMNKQKLNVKYYQKRS